MDQVVSSKLGLHEVLSKPSGDDYKAAVSLFALSSMDEGIHIVDSAGKTVFFNDAMGRIDGLDPAQVQGRHLSDVYSGLTPETSTLLRVLKTGEPIRDVVQTYSSPNGGWITTINTTLPILMSGKCIAAMEVAKTITRVKRLYERANVSDPLATLKRRRARECENGTVYSLPDILGCSDALKKVKSIAEKVAGYDLPVMIHGETGSGKELFAQSIHNASKRAGHQFIAVNCSALPESLIESTLFGNVKGAFTGALDHEGLFEQANGGTLFLDEINSASPSLQGKLLRVLEENTIRRVGAHSVIPVDVRILTSCNADPILAVHKGHLRSDLFYRLSVYAIRIPPLRERKEDIRILVHSFAERAASAIGVETPGFSDEVMNAFLVYDWPGNVRELKNAVQSSVGLCPGAQNIGLEDLPDSVRESLLGFDSPTGDELPGAWCPFTGPAGGPLSSLCGQDGFTLDRALQATETDLIAKALRENGGKISGAAKALGVSRQSLHYRMAKNRMKKPF